MLSFTFFSIQIKLNKAFREKEIGGILREGKKGEKFNGVQNNGVDNKQKRKEQ